MKQDLDPLGQAVTDYIDVLSGKKPAGEATIGGEQDLTNDQRSRLPYVMAMYHTCFLCGAEPPPTRIYTWKVKDQTLLTPICGPCSLISEVNKLIEKVIKQGEIYGSAIKEAIEA